ncbi:MAG: hypothetical protein A2570_02080 [Candidatus Brennerbacteria bacterium RIFOXYD1_FULL_41_16]|uniref:DUF5667 domain-containing protein n=1 Tax=Candidatus Brennerbacteria bacterium RIFOXYD1_FULL_41_16 TaxID=1797529 RepID=A0A1G1XK89_9BACT|nr:MAG: Protein tolA [Parcubacteria group bacterium GW2011_GWB1_41_4]OGY40513.1 MAG: hypothetical protein A2570_02080 [Candidatus Brennerbacteria bacterium RIFOXYD1_FULL_41_16]
MIQLNFKQIVVFVLVFVFSVSVFSSLTSAATSTPGFRENICSRLTNFISKMEVRVSEKEQRIRGRHQDGIEKRGEKLEAWDARREERRASANEKMTDFFLKFEQRAQTDIQKQAVAVFKAAVLAAIQTRQAVVDAAIVSFRSEAEKLLAERKSVAETAVAVYKVSQKAAFDKARSSCESGVDPKTVLETLKTELKAAKDKFEVDRQAIEIVASKIRALNETKKAAFDKAHGDFKVALEKAKLDLKAAFPQPTLTPAISQTTTPTLSPTP